MNQTQNKRISIYFSYSWKKDEETSNGLTNNSHKAFLKIRENLKSRMKELENSYDFKRLRGSAGKNILDNISYQIQKADLIIIDITSKNPNVMIELGMALAFKSNEIRKSIFLICEDEIKDHLPSNMSGYFVSHYIINEKACTFKDNGSLLASLSSEIKSIYRERNYDRFPEDRVDEIESDLEE